MSNLETIRRVSDLRARKAEQLGDGDGAAKAHEVGVIEARHRHGIGHARVHLVGERHRSDERATVGVRVLGGAQHRHDDVAQIGRAHV